MSILRDIERRAGYTHHISWEEKLLKGILKGMWVNKGFSVMLPNASAERVLSDLYREHWRVRNVEVKKL